MENEILELSVSEEYDSERIDKYLSAIYENEYSRSYIQKLIEQSMVDVNGVCIKNNYRVKNGDFISITIPPPEKIDVIPEDIDLDIVYEDSSIAVINKPPGMVVHPGSGNTGGTLVNAIMYRIRDLSSIGGVERPGIVHRLDRDTSGLIVIAKNDIAHRVLSEAFAERRVEKKYKALVIGRMQNSHGAIDLPVGRHPVYGRKMTVIDSGRPALTEYRVDNYWNTGVDFFSLLDIRIHTGRTHQIRVHLSSRGNPVVGDPIYSKKWRRYGVEYLLLASVGLGFRHPESGEELYFKAPLPEHFDRFMKKLKKS